MRSGFQSHDFLRVLTTSRDGFDKRLDLLGVFFWMLLFIFIVPLKYKELLRNSIFIIIQFHIQISRILKEAKHFIYFRPKPYIVSGIKKWDHKSHMKRKKPSETFHNPCFKLIQRSLLGVLCVYVDHLLKRKQVSRCHLERYCLSTLALIKSSRNEIIFLN